MEKNCYVGTAVNDLYFNTHAVFTVTLAADVGKKTTYSIFRLVTQFGLKVTVLRQQIFSLPGTLVLIPTKPTCLCCEHLTGVNTQN